MTQSRVSTRLRIVYAIIFVIAVALALQVVSFERQIVDNCRALNEAHRKFNTFLDQSIINAQNTTGLTPAQKQAALDKYADLHLFIQHCPRRPL